MQIKDDSMPPRNCINWFFGRGLSIACNLPWVVPREWRDLPRAARIERIKDVLRHEMESEAVDCTVIRTFLNLLAANTTADWRHYFLTTNWDYLLQREILNLELAVLPRWLADSHVSHLNGTVEVLPNNTHRSPFLLEEDPASERCWTVEANVAFNHLIWHRLFVVVGMSFECETDKFLLHALSKVEDEMPIGESTWLVLNPDRNAVDASCARIQQALPRANVRPILSSLGPWLAAHMPELAGYGVLAF